MPRAPKSPSERQERRHNPLADDYTPALAKEKAPKRRRLSQKNREEDVFVDSKASRRILRIGQELADEDASNTKPPESGTISKAFTFESRFDSQDEEDNQDDYGDEEAWGEEEEEIVEEVETDPSDLDLFNRFNPSFDDPILRPGEDAPEAGQATNLADLILEKIAAHESQGATGGGPVRVDDPPEEAQIPPKVIEVYSKYVAYSLERIRQMC